MSRKRQADGPTVHLVHLLAGDTLMVNAPFTMTAVSSVSFTVTIPAGGSVAPEHRAKRSGRLAP